MKTPDSDKTVLASGSIFGLSILNDGMTYAQTNAGGLTSIIQPEPSTLILALNQQQPTGVIGSKIYESLLSYDFDIKPIPQLAESWDISDDGLTYTFKLVKNAKWHDGKPFSAADVVFSCNVMLKDVHPRAQATFSHCESITAPDDATVVFKLKHPFAPFLYAFEASSAPIMPKHIYEGTDYRKNPANDMPIGTGPFMLNEWDRGSYIHLVANSDYYREGKPNLTEIYYRVIPDAISRSVAMESGETQLAQWSDVETFEVKHLAAFPNIEQTTRGYELFSPVSWIEINLRRPPFDDVRFRRAMMHLIDKQYIVDHILFGLGKPATGAFASTTKFFRPNLPQFEFNVEKANALLDEIGMTPDASGRRITFKFLIPPYGEMVTRNAEFFRDSMAAGGLHVILDTTDMAGWASSIANWEYDATSNLLYQYGDPALGVARTYISSNIRKGVLFSNTQGYSNPEVDRLFSEAELAPDDEKRQELYSQVQAILAVELPVLWLSELRYSTLYDKRLQSLVADATGVNGNFADARYT